MLGAAARAVAPRRARAAVRSARSAAVPAAWITGLSASGSEKGIPSSSSVAPARAHARPIASDASGLGKPPIK